MALHWIMYAEPGARHHEAFANGLRYNITEVAPNFFGLQVRRMDDSFAESHNVGHSLDEVKIIAESIKLEDVKRPKMEELPNGNPA